MLDIRFTVPAVALLPPALVAAAVLLGLARARGWDRRMLAWRLVLVAYLTTLAAATFFPFQVVVGRYAPEGAWSDAVQLLPIVTADARSFLLNVLMTVPLGFLLPLLDRRFGFGRVVLTGLLVSIGIEAAQLATGVLLGASRSADVNDLIANTLGAGIGCLASQAVAPALRRLRALPSGAPAV